MIALLPLTFLLLAQPDSALDKAVAKFNTPEALAVTYTSRLLSGNKQDWKLKLVKPDKMLAESESQIFIVEGSQVTEYTKAGKTFTRKGGEIGDLTSKPELLPARLFFEKPEWLSKTKATAPRTRNGVRITGNEATLEGTRKATLYVSDAGDLVLLQVEYPQGTGTETVLIDKFELTPGPIDASAFSKVIPADATEQAEPPKPLSEAAKKAMADGRMPYKKLTWEDFEYRDQNDGSYYIGTWREYSYHSKSTKVGNGYQSTITDWEILAG
ncbi:MAG TPA: hypothetical protein VK934_03065, partial [Fimbriimonas sp.]|nr:hypothetical protein [Fimbriimonas sp.]